MPQISLNRITNANVYIDGDCLLGTVEEIKLPEIKAIMTEHKALGMVGKIELPSGFDKLEGEIKWNSFYREFWAKISNPFVAVQLQCRSSVETHGSMGRGIEQALVTFLTVQFKDVGLGNFKQNDNAEFTSKFSCTAVKQQIAGRDVIELDVLANIFKVDGVDQLDAYRANLGGI